MFYTFKLIKKNDNYKRVYMKIHMFLYVVEGGPSQGNHHMGIMLVEPS